MKVLLTGGAGFIGSHITDRLVEEAHGVVVIDNLSTGYQRNVNPHAKFYKIDITDAEALDQVFALEKPNIVSHHAAQVDVRRSMDDPKFDATVNVLGILNILQLCVKYKAKKIVFASTSAVFNEPVYLPMDERHPVDPLSAYGVTKYTAELYLRLYSETYGLRYTAFRYGNVYGPRQDPHGECGVVAIFSEQMLTGVQPTIFGDGSKTRDYIFVDDIVQANMIAMSGLGDGEVFTLGWGKEITDFEVFDTVRKAVNIQVEPIYSKKRPGEVDRICLDSSKAQDQLKWKPKVDFREGIPLAVEYYRSLHTAG